MYLSLGFFIVAFKTIFFTLCGTFSLNLSISGSSSCKCFKAIATADSPLNGIWPVIISNIKIPNE